MHTRHVANPLPQATKLQRSKRKTLECKDPPILKVCSFEKPKLRPEPKRIHNASQLLATQLDAFGSFHNTKDYLCVTSPATKKYSARNKWRTLCPQPSHSFLGRFQCQGDIIQSRHNYRRNVSINNRSTSVRHGCCVHNTG